MICYIKTMWERFWSLVLGEIPIDGHDWVDTEVHKNVTVTISICERCGKQEITWRK